MPSKLSRVDYLLGLPPDRRFRILRHELLSRIARSSVNRSYILRGSSVLKHWFGDAAREPQDLDLVAVYPHDPERCIAEVLLIGNDPHLRGPTFPVTRANMIPVWEYDIFPGVRFHVPSSSDYRTSTVQLDVAFDNDPELPTEEIELAGPEGLFPVRLRAWTREACLASKLCWIANDTADSRADASDLFDALLLAKQGEIEADILQICVQDVLRAQKRDVAAFDGLHAAVLREMKRGGTTDRGFPPEMPTSYFWNEREQYHRKSRARADAAARATDALVYDLVYEVAPLLADTIWFPPREEWGFLLAIAGKKAAPVDSFAYADWLMDRDDPRGEYLRLHVDASAPAWTEADERRVAELEERIPRAWRQYVGLE